MENPFEAKNIQQQFICFESNMHLKIQMTLNTESFWAIICVTKVESDG